MRPSNSLINLTFKFVLIIGIVNFFADFTYEGARSVMGPFLGSLGASAITVGFVAGFGEMIGYVLRSVTGYLADKTHKYWAFVFIGYFVNMLAVPALALAGNWHIAAILMIAERTGRAFRKPSVETMLSYSTQTLGRGWVFGLNEAMDQAGATLGPLIVALVMFLKHGSYRWGFAALSITAVLCLCTVIVARILYPRPHELDTKPAEVIQAKGFSKSYWLFVVAGALLAAGFADFSLISFHFQKASVLSAEIIPVFYAIAMAVAAISSLVFGRLLDKLGFSILLVAFFLAAFYAPFAFSGTLVMALVGMILWGLGLGAQESLLKAELITIISSKSRASAFGIFDTIFGIGWFLGSFAMGLIYDKSIVAIVILAVVLQLAAIPVLYFAKKSAMQA